MNDGNIVSLPMAWLHDEGWEYHLKPVVATDGIPEHFQPFIDLWRSRMDGDVCPAWRDFDLMDFEDWWGWVSAFDEVPGNPNAFDVRLWGSRVANTARFELSGKRVHGTKTTPDNAALNVTDSDILFMRKVLDEKVVGYCHGPVHLEVRGLGHYQMVVLPLSPNREGIASVMTAARVKH